MHLEISVMYKQSFGPKNKKKRAKQSHSSVVISEYNPKISFKQPSDSSIFFKQRHI